MLLVTTGPDITAFRPPLYEFVETVRGVQSMPPQNPNPWPTFGGSNYQPPMPVQTPPTPSWSDALHKNFAELRSLRAGWDGPKSEPVNRALLYVADRILRDALDQVAEARAPYVVPIRDGSIQLEWHSVQYDFEIVISANSPVYAWLRDRITKVEVEGEGDQATDLILRWTRRVASPARDEVPGANPHPQGAFLLAA